MKKVVLYGHNGCGNHGCEALVRTTVDVVRRADADDITLISTQPEQDKKYVSDLGLQVKLLGSTFEGISPKRIFAKLVLLISNSYKQYDKKEMASLFEVKNSLCISIGGDNYCYSDFDSYSRMNKYLKENENKTILWGCSISPELLENPDVMKDLSRYDIITARESITYDNLVKAGLTNVKYAPDTAFLLPCEQTELPFKTDKVIGINLSPLVIEREKKPGIVQKSFENLIEYILNDTDYEIALIPHVHNEYSEDLDALRPLYEKYRATNRIYLIDEDKTLDCRQLKYVISNLSFLITARTHASIAAYSTGVPTLVIGYSVKSRGIAKDIFGDYKEYVCGVEDMNDGSEVLNAFCRLYDNKDSACTGMQKYIKTIDGCFEAITKVMSDLL